MIKTQLTVQQKLDRALEHIWDNYAMGDDKRYAYALFNIGFTREEVIDELMIDCGLEYKETLGLIYELEEEWL